ncbi:MAG: hypothetical protein ABI685_03545 [Ferruginibacter sp.]
MRQLILLLSISLLLFSCSQNDTKQKDAEPAGKDTVVKEKEIVQLVKDTPIVTQPTVQKSKDELWDEFWTQFSAAVNKKDKKSMIELSLKGPDFFDGGGGGTAEQWINTADNETWQYWQKAVAKGVKTYEKTQKITKNDFMIFEFKDGKWVWTAVVGD